MASDEALHQQMDVSSPKKSDKEFPQPVKISYFSGVFGTCWEEVLTTCQFQGPTLQRRFMVNYVGCSE